MMVITMWKTHLHHLCLRAWNSLLGALSTSNLNVAIFTVLIPVATFLALLIFNCYWNRNDGRRLREKIKASVIPTLIVAVITVVAWIALFSWSVAATIYRDHEFLVTTNGRLLQENMSLSSKLAGVPPQKVTNIVAAVDRFGPIDRYLNAEQKDHLYQELKQVAARQMDKNGVTVTVVPAYPCDRESSRLMWQLQRVFQDAGWNVVGQQVRDYSDRSHPVNGRLPIGIWVYSAVKGMDLAVESSLLDAGLSADTAQGREVTDQPMTSGTIVMIGYKASPF